MRHQHTFTKNIILVAALILFGATRTFAADLPNIVIMLSDDHSLLDSTVYGSKDVKTPNMQRIAEAGVVFDRAFVASPSCAPSRAALLTGLYPSRNGAEPNHAAPRADIKKLPAYLQALGYEVVAIGKVGHYNQTADYGFDYYAHTGFHDDVAIAEGVKWLRARKSKKPLCIFLGTNWPHTPWPQTGEGFTPDQMHIPSNHVDTEKTKEARTKYYAAIARMDAELGAVYDAAYAVLGQNTFFLHTSDHGAQWPFGKWNLYDGGIRTPMMAVWPGQLKPGTRSDAMVSWLDVLPTLIEVAGGTPPQGLDGLSLLPVLRGEKTQLHDRIFTTHSGDGEMNIYPIRSLRTTDWKYIRNLHPEFYYSSHVDIAQGASYFDSWVEKAATDRHAAETVRRYHVRPSEELYDLKADPLETHNLAADPSQSARLAEMRAEVDAWMKANGDTGKVYAKPRLLSDSDRAVKTRGGKKKGKSDDE